MIPLILQASVLGGLLLWSRWSLQRFDDGHQCALEYINTRWLQRSILEAMQEPIPCLRVSVCPLEKSMLAG